MPAGAIGETWAADSWEATCWEEDSWGESGGSSPGPTPDVANDTRRRRIGSFVKRGGVGRLGRRG